MPTELKPLIGTRISSSDANAFIDLMSVSNRSKLPAQRYASEHYDEKVRAIRNFLISVNLLLGLVASGLVLPMVIDGSIRPDQTVADNWPFFKAMWSWVEAFPPFLLIYIMIAPIFFVFLLFAVSIETAAMLFPVFFLVSALLLYRASSRLFRFIGTFLNIVGTAVLLVVWTLILSGASIEKSALFEFWPIYPLAVLLSTNAYLIWKRRAQDAAESGP